ncbi:WXG100 family type VII secretion target [Schumannella sp. 10F1B-5-1]|uniref:WXG100 family type VII secretion target n=1 Tax=Schumannella sp. 10F1B-5-1 TaxID=2590780 RepID=UPI00113243DB|nr:WXG100 family type VII secretion target [Schumannella sp. 10F1B-5-1]TPW76745.1 WXG100 family type VII secretion target [Schumannella sp. 10F1B-5-1]
MAEIGNGDFSVTPEVLREVAASLGAESRHLAGVLGDLEQRVKALEGGWDGAARQAYSEAQRGWSAAITDMTSILGQIGQRTEQIAEGYVADDKASAKRFTHPQ